MRMRQLEVNGGQVLERPHWRLALPPTSKGYANAQIDDYGFEGASRGQYPWKPGTTLNLRARFSSEKQLRGTAGFGFWNAPFGDPTIGRLALPQAAWFFFASEPNDLPFPLNGPGRGWFAATIDASGMTAMALIPFAPFVLLLNQLPSLRRRIWPAVRKGLKISYAPISQSMNEWHTYGLAWMPSGCSFQVDEATVLQTPCSPSGPLGFVCWVDNQYLIATKRGRVGWGTIRTRSKQSLEVDNLTLS